MEKENFFFQGDLKKYEESILDFLLEDTEIHGGDPNITRIFLYVLLHHRLTQQKLSSLTGFPKSKISKITSDLVTQNILAKTFKPGTHTNEYYLIDQPFKLNLVPYSHLLFIFQKRINFCNKLIEDLKDIDNDKNPGKPILIWRINDFLLYSKANYAMIKYFQDKNTIDGFNLEKIWDEKKLFTPEFEQEFRKALEYSYNIEKNEDIYSTELKKYEFRFLNFLLDDILLKEKPSIELILGYFMTRGKLTQKKIQVLTGFSAGTISQSLNTLLEQKRIIILSSQLHRSNAKIYAMPSITYNLLEYKTRIYKDITRWTNVFSKIKEELNETSNRILLLEGYFAIYTIVDKIQTIFLPRYKRNLQENIKLLALVNELPKYQEFIALGQQ